MKKLLLIALILFFATNVFGGELQTQYEKSKTLNFPQSPDILLIDDYKTFKNHGDSIYGLILGQLDTCTPNSNDCIYAEKVKNNYTSHFIDTNAWEYIDVPNNVYKNLNEGIKVILLLNNMIYKEINKNF